MEINILIKRWSLKIVSVLHIYVLGKLPYPREISNICIDNKAFSWIQNGERYCSKVTNFSALVTFFNLFYVFYVRDTVNISDSGKTFLFERKPHKTLFHPNCSEFRTMFDSPNDRVTGKKLVVMQKFLFSVLWVGGKANHWGYWKVLLDKAWIKHEKRMSFSLKKRRIIKKITAIKI